MLQKLFSLKNLKASERVLLRQAAEERFDFFNLAFLSTPLQDFHLRWFEFQLNNARTLVLGPRASWKCIDAETMIPTVQGVRRLHELSPSYPSLLAFSASINHLIHSCLGLTKATQVFNRGLEPALEIETEHGFTIKCSLEHRFLVYDSSFKFKAAGDLKCGDLVVMKGQWSVFAAEDSNPYGAPPEIWFPMLVFLYGTYPNRWPIIWRERLARNRYARPLWKFFNHSNWGTLPPQLESFLRSQGFGTHYLPNCLRNCTFKAAQIIAKAFWWYNQHLKFTVPQAQEVQTWFLNLGLPVARYGPTLQHINAEARQHFLKVLESSEPVAFDYFPLQVERLAELIKLRILNSSFTPPIVKFRLRNDYLSKDYRFIGHPKKARKFVDEYLPRVPHLRRASVFFRPPFFLQSVTSIKPSRCIMMDLSTIEGNYIANGFVTHNSTVLDRHYSIWRALRDPNVRIGIISKSSILSSSFVAQIKNILETNEKIRAVWPDLIQPSKAPKWNNTEVTLIRTRDQAEATFTALGVGSTLAGRHFDILIFDDVVDTDCQTSPLLRKKIWDWFRFVAMQTLSLSEETQAHVIGTLYHPDDLYHKIIEFEKEGKGGWKSLIQPAINPDGTSFWEEAFPLEELQKVEQTYGTDVFRLQYQNDPEFGGIGVYRWDEFESFYYDSEPLPFDLNDLDIVIGVDLASPGLEKTSHHSAFAVVVLGVNHSDRMIYVLEAIKRKRLLMSDQRAIIESLCSKYRNVSVVQVEAYALQTYFHEYLNESTEVLIPIRKVQTGGTKESRHEFIMAMLQNGRLKLRRDIDRELVEELLNFPSTSADLIDALYLALKGVQREPKIRFLSW